LLQVLDDGRLTDGQGRTVDFKNTFLIMTSNLITGDKEKDILQKLKNFFKPEFINRLDEIIVFHTLKQEDIRQIVDIQIARLQERLKEHHIQLHLDDAAKDWLAKNGHDAEFGARPLKRLIQQEVENPLAIELLNGHISDNSEVYLSVKQDKLIIS